MNKPQYPYFHFDREGTVSNSEENLKELLAVRHTQTETPKNEYYTMIREYIRLLRTIRGWSSGPRFASPRKK